MERLHDIVTQKEKDMAGHILQLHTESPAHASMYWVLEEGRRKMEGV